MFDKLRKLFKSEGELSPEHQKRITQLEEIWDSNLNNVIGKFDKEFRDQIKVLPQFLG